MMTKSKQLMSDALDNLSCTVEEMDAIKEMLKDGYYDRIVSSYHAKQVAETLLETARDAIAEDTAKPKWERYHWGVRLCNGYDGSERFPHCMVQATHEIITDINGTQFRVYACDKHAGKEQNDE